MLEKKFEDVDFESEVDKIEEEIASCPKNQGPAELAFSMRHVSKTQDETVAIRTKKATKRIRKASYSKEEFLITNVPDSIEEHDEILEEDENLLMLNEDEASPKTSVDFSIVLNELHNEKYESLSAPEETALFNAYIASGRSLAIKQEIANHYLRLVLSLAKKYHSKNSLWSISEYFSEGVIGLFTAIDKFDMTRKTRFSTCAYFWILQAIKRSFEKNYHTIRTPVHYQSINRKLNKAKADICSAIGCAEEEITLDMLSEETGIPVNQIKLVIEKTPSTSSLDVTIDDNGSTMGKMLPTEDEKCSPEEEYEQKELNGELKKTMSNALNENEIYVIGHMYGIDGFEQMEVKEIAEKLNITPERVRQINTKALRKMKHPSKSGNLRPFMY